MEDDLITITGTGALHVVPDVTRVELILCSVHDTYQEAYEQAKSNTDTLTHMMAELGLSAKLPKTTSFNIEKKTQNEYDSDNNYIGKKFIGFGLDHHMRIDLGMDTVLLNKLVRLTGQKLKQAEISIGYTVKNPRPIQLEMLRRAVKDAMEKAAIMAQACGCKLGKVKKISYGQAELHVYAQTRNISADEAPCCTEQSLDITPADLSVSDEVTVSWHLVNADEA